MYNLEKLVVSESPSDAVKLYCSGCPKCGRKYFPLKELCVDCLETCETVQVGPYGNIFSYTRVGVDSPLYKAPYTLAFIDLDDGVRLLARVDESKEKVGVGKRVKSVRASFPTKSGETIHAFAFEMTKEDQ
ncbi:Zn-ribbon domain-containing OB-fold protein [Bacillus sp. FJAT-29814]|uniref:Zn-ribbon domain-containing OB-fold protein n=1 Tax=Bacillus sp. FJAT-29814 TaxID=1729688 RepID=UPI000834EE3E|nr:OB-fold domain-containing protein [Bacillus sp. FJAT-29814]